MRLYPVPPKPFLQTRLGWPWPISTGFKWCHWNSWISTMPINSLHQIKMYILLLKIFMYNKTFSCTQIHGLQTHDDYIPYSFLPTFKFKSQYLGRGSKGLFFAEIMVESTPNAPKCVCPIFLPKPKSLGFQWKKASLGVRSPCSK